jgi:hypothetical protein
MKLDSNHRVPHFPVVKRSNPAIDPCGQPKVKELFPFRATSLATFGAGGPVTSSPQKNLILPQQKSRKTRCLQFAARLVGAVNVRDLHESHVGRKCLAQPLNFVPNNAAPVARTILNAAQAIEQAAEFHATEPNRSRCTPPSACIDTLFPDERRAAKPQKAADCLRFAATRLKFAARLARGRAMRDKPFNRRRFCSRSEPDISVLPPIRALTFAGERST